MRVLLVEDDAVLGDALRRSLVRQGYPTDLVTSGSAAIAAVAEREPDVVLLDMGLPDRDGIGVCREIRERSRVPILAITGRGDVAARVQGLRSGADDYLVKPVSTDELVARIEAVLRRATGAAVAATVSVGDVVVDLDRRAVTAAGTEVALTRKEFDLLAALARREGAVLPRTELLEQVWGTADASAARTLEAHVASLRSKLGARDVVVTVRGVGYRLAR
ncbi:putative two-component system response regulator [Pseudonocardia sp. Ae706_Ps2]|uniref:response regulator transcription factor n=1 Tax=unclassified Pseudonocardia TaxID=2619320 RepID=UPI00094B4B56|nr:MULTISPECIES: response regulator transcription factor [unclassified Pseudonocardia]KAA1030726.1 response regulator transcription factor [Pseudonocardia sp. EV170527-09]OLM06133.1 putative two-component system response regulator [Pseudonocardia sp. Ae331_Ps2]OLM15215.1 putative two-component system response regulator [Pseudonocardia sp. Ae505_Ps2]OLM23658.1 putative two-component system response regulator [Pseudonocardia sp. Ae706_Ps2]OLM30375.1 putative two-component system response regulat